VELSTSDGEILEKGIIDHPGSVVVLPMQGEDVLILRQYRLSLEETILELPAGTREPGEEWLACARRELREETGYRAENWTPLGHVWPAPGITNEEMAIYLASDLSRAPLPADVDEEIEVVKIPLKELEQMALDGRLMDAKSVVALIRAAAYIHSSK
jgi:ADP-ribose pyrophosphatase